jgi:hypothetical protein
LGVSWIVRACGMGLYWLAERVDAKRGASQSGPPLSDSIATRGPAEDIQKISGSTFYFRVMFPTVWFGFMTFLAVSSLWNRNMAELLIPLAGSVFGFFLFKKMAWDLLDVVYDA